MARGILIVIALLYQSAFCSDVKSTSSARKLAPACPVHQGCMTPNSDRIHCRAIEYYWMQVDHTSLLDVNIPENAQLINSRAIAEKFGEVFLGQYRSHDDQIQVTTLNPNGSINFDNGGNIASQIEILCNHKALQSNRFSYHTVWPGTMQSNVIAESPDMREAAVIIGIEYDQFVYFGKIVGNEPIFGKVTWNDAIQKYELIYRDAMQMEQRVDQFYILIMHECLDYFLYDSNTK